MSYLFPALALLIACGAGVALCALVWLTYTRLVAGAALILLMFLWTAVEVFPPALSVGIVVHPSDAAFMVLAAAAGLRAMLHLRRDPVVIAWLAFGALLAASFLFGLYRFRAGAAGVEFRPYFYFYVGTLYFMTFAPTARELGAIAKMMFGACGVLLAIACGRWIMDAADWYPVTRVWLDASGIEFRVLTAAQALFLAQALLLLAFTVVARRASAPAALMLPLAAAVLVLQHRSVWIVTAAGLLAMFVMLGQARAQLAAIFGVVALVGAAIAAPLLGGGYLDAVTDSVAAASTNTGTLVGRYLGWKLLFADWLHAGPLHHLFGNPFGSGFVRIQSGQEIGYSPHNYFLQTLLRVGIAGLGALMIAYALALRRLAAATRGSHDVFDRPALAVLLVTQLVFYIPYSPSAEQSIFTGLAFAIARGASRRAEERGVPANLPGGARA